MKFNDYSSINTNTEATDQFYSMTFPKCYPSMLSNSPQNIHLHNFNKLDMYNQFKINCESNNVLTSNVVRNSVITASGMVWALAGFIPIAGTIISTAGGVVNVLLPLFWDEDTTFQSQQLMCKIGRIINAQIDQYAFSAASAYLEGLQKLLNVYQEVVKDWQNPHSKKSFHKAAEDVRGMFRQLHSNFIVAMPMFKIEGFEIQLLQIYAKAATTHLSLLRDVVKFGHLYGFDDVTLNGFYKYLVVAIEEYTNHCTFTYKKGLEMAKKQEADLNDKDKYPWIPSHTLIDYQQIENWNLFNEYRRIMTLLVLDLVAVWPMMDSKLYSSNNDIMDVKTSLTRKLYTNVQGHYSANQETGPFITNVEKNIVQPPGLVRILQSSIFEYDHKRSLKGINRLFTHPFDDLVQSFVGENGVTRCSASSPINSIQFNYNWQDGIGKVVAFEKKITNQELQECGIEHQGDTIFQNEIPFDRTICSPPHQLSWINIGLSTWNTLNYIGCEWMHPSVDSWNTISKKKITQIPAVMAHTLGNAANVITGPGSTGGELVNLLPNGSIEITITVPKSVQAYMLRIRCANSQGGRLVISTNYSSDPVEVHIPRNEYYTSDLGYKSFQLVNVSSHFILKSATDRDTFQTLSIQCLDTEIILDKIEFIPQVSIPPLDTTGEIQNIAQKYKLEKWEAGKPDYEKGIYFSVPEEIMDFEDFQSLRYQYKLAGQVGNISLAKLTEHNRKAGRYYVYIDFAMLTPNGGELPTTGIGFILYVVDPIKNEIKSNIRHYE